MNSGLYVVATPIGNLGDMSGRAVDVLRGVQLIAAEDTRHSQRLLQHYAISTPVLAYHDHSHGTVQEKILACLATGGRVALISDAGTPLISDPGYRLVRHVQDSGFFVYPVPGACAAIAALSVSGLATDRFLFEGFLPAREAARAKRLETLTAETATLVFYEAPHRVLECLRSMVNVLGAGREAVLAREITKTFETVRRDTLANLVQFVSADAQQQKGEIVLLVAGREKAGEVLQPKLLALLRRLAEDLPAKRAAAIVAQYSGVRKNLLYQQLLDDRDQ